MKNQLTQCVFRRDENNLARFTVGWIETKAAKIGNSIELLDFGKGSFWKVVDIGSTMSEHLLQNQQDGMREFQYTLKIGQRERN